MVRKRMPGSVVVAIAVLVGAGVGLANPAGANASWSFLSSPNPAGSFPTLNSVVCLTTSNCVAVGSYDLPLTAHSPGGHGLVERWNGKRWSVVPSPGPRIFSLLSSVSCTAPGFCVAVGWRAGGSLVEQWNGARWRVVPSANRPHAMVWLTGVSCRTSKDCVAVGSYFGGVGQYSAIEHWDGRHWTMVPSPNVPPAADPGNNLLGVSCTTGSACVAVGSFGGTAGGPLIERWDGAHWSIMPGAAGGGIGDALRSVKCTSNTSCVAVGYTGKGKGLIERWDGSTWTIVPSPTRSGNSGLSSVKCVTASDCVAVGGQSIQRQFPGPRLIEHWNGITWSIVPSPAPASTSHGSLAGVSCATSTSCMAVGEFMTTQYVQKTFVERYSQ